MRSEEKLVMDLSMDEFLLKSGDFVAWKVIVHLLSSISRVFEFLKAEK